MDKVITCKCGSQEWVIGESGTRCAKCTYWLDAGCVVANVDEINEHIDSIK